MKARKEVRKSVKDSFPESDEAKKSRKLKPLKKEKNVKRTLYQEIDDLEDIDMDFDNEDLEILEDELFDEEDYDEDDDNH